MMEKLQWLPAIAAGCILLQASWAGPLYSSGNTPNGQAFVSACSGSQAYGGIPNPGDSAIITDASAPYNNCAQAQGASVFTGWLNNPVVNPPLFQPLTAISNTSAIDAKAGQIGFYATNTAAPVDVGSGAWGSGGWNDSFTWTGPTGMWLPKLIVDANLSVQFDSCTPQGAYTCPSPQQGPPQPYGEAILEVNMLLNDSFLETPAEMNAFAANNPNTVLPANQSFTAKFGDWLSAPGLEMAGWWADGTTPVLDANNQIVTFAIPVTQGQQVNLGVYASYMVSGGDGGNITINTETIDPLTAWDGGSIQTTNGILPVVPGDFGPSASGFDYSQAATPEPGALFLGILGLGLCALAGPRRRK